jgi:L-ascorbate 6-phosphate lactonase
MATGEITSLDERISRHRATSNRLACWWLGGSGFVFKSAAGTVIYVDPYLSDSVKRIFGVGRAFPPPIAAQDVRADAVISSHWHEDHLDPGTIPAIAEHSPSARFFMPPSAMSRALGWGIARDRITPLMLGASVRIGDDVTLTVVPARHEAGVSGWEVPDAIGIILESRGVKVYHSGDTEYDIRLRMLKAQQLDVAILCINGVSGNMDAHEAALLAWQLGAGVVIPMHYSLWAENAGDTAATLDPRLFADTYARLGGAGRVVLPEVGQEICLESAEPPGPV